MSGDIAISVQGVSKDFHYNSNQANSVKAIITGVFKEDAKSKDIQHALKGISFDIKKGEFFGIVGRNGSGKSTLLKIIAGIYQPNKGRVSVDGKLVPFIELGVGFNPELTGKENVYLNGALLGFSSREIKAMYDEIVEFAELEKFMNQKLKNYSSGMQVRLAFSMAIRAQSDILLIDEVLAVGDADFQRKCFDYFKSLKNERKTVVFVSHDMHAVREYCDRAVLIENNSLMDQGSPTSIANQYSQLFINNYKDTTSHNNTVKRRGDNAVEITNVTVPKVIKLEKELSIQMTLKANEPVSDANIGFEIKAADGKTIMGTNTILCSDKTYHLEKGQKVRIDWIIPNIFEDGKYNIDCAVVYNGSEVADWRYDVTSFRSLRVNRTSFIVSPPVTYSIEA